MSRDFQRVLQSQKRSLEIGKTRSTQTGFNATPRVPVESASVLLDYQIGGAGALFGYYSLSLDKESNEVGVT